MQGYQRDVTVIPERQGTRDRITSLPITSGRGFLQVRCTLWQRTPPRTFAEVKSFLFGLKSGVKEPKERWDEMRWLLRGVRSRGPEITRSISRGGDANTFEKVTEMIHLLLFLSIERLDWNQQFYYRRLNEDTRYFSPRPLLSSFSFPLLFFLPLLRPCGSAARGPSRS